MKSQVEVEVGVLVSTVIDSLNFENINRAEAITKLFVTAFLKECNDED